MHIDPLPENPAHLVWICPMSLSESFNATEWLEITRALRASGWQVDLVGMGPGGRQSIRGVEVLCISSPDVYLLRQVVFHLKCLRFLAREGGAADAVLFAQISALWLLPIRLMRRVRAIRRPLLVMNTRTVPMETRERSTLKDMLRGAFCNLMNRIGHFWVDGQTAITDRLAALVKIPPDQLWGTWPSGVSLEEFSRARSRRRWPSEGSPIHVTYIGRLHYERNLLPLCEAVEAANSEGMHFTLSLIGDGTERADLERLALQTENRIRVIPPVSHEEIPGLLAQAHIGALPFPDEEKFQVSSPIKLFEYMGAGLPILATRIACHTDVINGGKYVFWAEDHSAEGLLAAMRRAWSNRDSLEAMGREAAAAARNWTWAESARKLETALLLGMRARREIEEAS